MQKPIVIKKKLDKGAKMAYEDKQDESVSVSSDKGTKDSAGKVGIKREEVIDALKSLEGVKRKLRKALDSA